jgi:hypothetical protein
MIKIVNGIPEKLVEMDEQVSFMKQMMIMLPDYPHQ